MWQGKVYLKTRHYPIFSKKVLEGMFLEMSKSIACMIPFSSLFILTFGFGYKNAWLNSKKYQLSEPICSSSKDNLFFFFLTKFNANPKDKVLNGVQWTTEKSIVF